MVGVNPLHVLLARRSAVGVVGARDDRRACPPQRFIEEGLRVLEAEVLAAQAVYPVHAEGAVVRVVLESGLYLDAQVAALAAEGVAPVADEGHLGVSQGRAELLRREGPH